MPRFKYLRVLAILAALLLAAVSFAGCATQSQAPAEDRSDSATPEDGGTPSKDAAEEGNSLPILDPGSVDPGKKIIYTVDMSIRVEDTAQAINAIMAVSEELGGYVSGSQYYEAGRQVGSYVTVRVPPENLKEFATRVGALGKVESQSMQSQDVTEQYTDLTSRLTNAQAQEEQLLAIMDRATTIEDILLVREQLNAVQSEIEVLKGQIRLMDNQVGYSTVTIRLSQPAPPAVAEDEDAAGVQFWGFKAIGQRIGRGFADSFNWTLNALGVLLMGLSYILLPLALIAAFVLLAVYLIRWLVRRGQRKNAPRK